MYDPHLAIVQPHSDTELSHRDWLHKLREHWLEQDKTTIIRSNSVTPVIPQEDSLHMAHSPCKFSTPHHRLTARTEPSPTGEMDSESLVSSIQCEAETAQKLADLMVSTETMKRRKNLYDDMTYRCRGAKAKQTLQSYSPRPPRAAKWGLLFDSMVAKLRGQAVEEADENDCSSISMSSDCSSISSHSSYHWDEPNVDSVVYHTRCPSATDTASESQLNTSNVTHSSRPTSLACNNGEFWEENWVTPDTPDDEVLTNTTVEMCNVCRSGQESSQQHPYSINLCYKNHKCLQSLANSNVTQDGNANLDPQQLRDELKAVVVRRPELGVLCQLPEPPIRKTESNNPVWKEKIVSSMTPTSKPAKRNFWKRFKKLFRSR